jgi:hypothetical protein
VRRVWEGFGVDGGWGDASVEEWLCGLAFLFYDLQLLESTDGQWGPLP